MADYTTDKIRNIVLLGHSSSGKTSVCEAMMFDSKATTRLGTIDAGNTVSDYSDDEIERKITISASVMHTEWNGCKVNIIDTPGYADFIGESIAALRAVDAGVLVVCGLNGLEIGTERAWEMLDTKGAPRAIFINRLDKENADFYKVVSEIQERFGKKCIPIQVAVGSEVSFKGGASVLNDDELKSAGASDDDISKARVFKDALIEAAAETDDKLIEKYLDSGELSKEEFNTGLKKAISTGQIIPILCGCATKDLSIKPLLDLIVDYMPAPDAKSDEPFSGFVFKAISDPYVGQLSIFRVVSGILKSDTGFYNATTGTKERIGQLMALKGKEQVSIAQAHAGDIVAVAKLKSTHSSDTICDQAKEVKFDPIALPEAAISRAVKPHSRADEEKISDALGKLAGEDPTFKLTRDTQTKEMIISGLGDLHLDIMVARLKKRFNVNVDVGMPKVAYKETVTGTTKVQGRYKKQTGGRGQFGDVWIELEPLARGGDFEFVNKIVGGAIPRNYIPSVEKGIRNAMNEGAVAGYPMVDMRVTLYDGSYHAVDSSDMAFQIAGSMAIKKAVLEAKPVLLEPLMDVEIVVPEEAMGGITGDINSRRGRIMGMESKGKNQVVKAQVPLAELLKYASELKSITGGRGSYTMRFSHYEQVPQKQTQQIIAQSQAAKEEKE